MKVARRNFLRAAGLGTAGLMLNPWSSLLAEYRESGKAIPAIKIKKIIIHNLSQELREPMGYCCSSVPLNLTKIGASIVEVQTDQGITGWGDGPWGGATLTRNPGLVIGRSPFEVESIYESLGDYDRDIMEAGGLDVALWDIIGQVLGKPVSQIIGKQHRTRVMPYASGGYRKNWPDVPKGFADEMRYWTTEKGYKAVKIKTGYGVEEDVEIIGAVREAIGPNVKLGIDSGTPGIYDDGSAVGLGRQLEQFNLEFWEEPIEKWDLEGYDRLRNAVRIPLASGESLPIDWVIKNYINRQTVDIVQPDIQHAGFTGAKKINYAAWMNRVRVIPHTWGSPIRIAATMHWCACVAHASDRFINPPPVLFELHYPHESVAWDITEQPIEVDKTDGKIEVPTGPGLGIKVIPEVLKKYRVGDPTVIN
jgi:D-galactarolactone cycloisomerase